MHCCSRFGKQSEGRDKDFLPEVSYVWPQFFASRGVCLLARWLSGGTRKGEK